MKVIKEKYDRSELEIIRLKTSDVLIASGDPDYEDDETPMMPPGNSN